MSEPRLRVDALSKRFGPTVALDRVTLSVGAGEIHAVVGENGAGKSTLMKVLAGAEAADAGSIRLDGHPYLPEDPLDARRHGVAMVYQELSLAPHLTVAENILLGAEPVRRGLIDGRAMRDRAGRALEELDRRDVPLDARVRDLPIAAQQVVEIARALAQSDTRVLILDEPTSSLSDVDVQKLFRAIRRLGDRGISIIYISHVLEEVQQIAARFTVLRDGRTAGTGETATTEASAIVSLMAGRQVDRLFPRSSHAAGEPLLDVSDLAGELRPTGASLTVHRGEVVGIGGVMGAGRTEFLRAIFGLDPIRSGRIRVAAWTGWAPPHARLRQGAGLVSEDRKEEGLALSMSVADNVTLSSLRGLGPGPLVMPRRQRAAASRWVDRLRIRVRSVDQIVRELSGGNQQKVALARLLHHDVDLFLLDEPTRGIDVGSKAEIYTLIDELALAGKAVLLVTSYLPELLGICDRVAVMHRGRLGPPRPVGQLSEHAVLMEATGQA